MPAYEVRDPIDVYEVRRRARVLCDGLGFSHHACLELALVVSELATNILKYGVRGSIDVRAIRDVVRGRGVELVARDEGPAFRDVSSALLDGHDDRGPIDPGAWARRRGLGTGLGAVVRLTHHLHVEPGPIGKRIVVRRYLTP
jgi:anti-sigma regulatory factor (Ser/Thr protein kinase)